MQSIAAEAKAIEGVTDSARIDAAYARVAKLESGAHPAVQKRLEELKAQLDAQSKQRANEAIAVKSAP